MNMIKEQGHLISDKWGPRGARSHGQSRLNPTRPTKIGRSRGRLYKFQRYCGHRISFRIHATRPHDVIVHKSDPFASCRLVVWQYCDINWGLSTQRLPLEGKLSLKATDEVSPETDR